MVDDGSFDGTREILQKYQHPRVKIFYHKKNQGKGAALRTAYQQVSGDYVIIQDADLEYDPQDWYKMIGPIQKGKATVVYGSRFTGERRNMLFWHWLGNHFLGLVVNILYNTTLSDLETCYKLVPTQLIRELNLKSNSFDIEAELTAKILKKGIRIYEVPISYAGREYHQGKKASWKDGLPALWTLLKHRFF